MNLYKHQVKHLERLKRAYHVAGAVLDASDTGTGKTPVACVFAKELGLKMAVVCPKSVIPSWERHIAAWSGMEPVFVSNYEAVRTGNHPNLSVRKTRDKHGRRRVYMHWEVPKSTLLVFDEVHKCKGTKTLNGKMLLKATRQGIPILGLSATAADSPLDMYALGHALKLHNAQTFFAWAMHYGCAPGYFSSIEFPTGTFRPGTKAHRKVERAQQCLGRLHEKIFKGDKPRGSRMRIAEIPEFPECKRITELLDFDHSASARKMKPELDALFAKMDADDEKHGEVLPLLERTRERQEMELLKVPTILEMVEDLKGSVVVFFNYRDSLGAFVSRLNEPSAVIIGEQEDREEQLGRFQSNEVRVMVCTIDAGGASVDLHDVHGGHPRTALICPTYSAVALRQALGRVHRSGAKSKAINKLLFAAGTVEEKVYIRVTNKLNRIDLLNDGDMDPEKS